MSDPLLPFAFGLLANLPPYYSDHEAPSERARRLEVIAESITSASAYATCTRDWASADWCVPIWPTSERKELIVITITQGFWESRFAKHVHEDRCGPDECDAIKLRNGRIYHRARSPWQLQRTAYVAPYWEAMRGSSLMATTSAAYAAVRVLSAARRRCGGKPELWISGYGWGSCRMWGGARKRAEMYEALLGRSAQEVGREDRRHTLTTAVELRPLSGDHLPNSQLQDGGR
jgi:hypothetical protein